MRILTLILLHFILSCGGKSGEKVSKPAFTRIAFGSCHDQHDGYFDWNPVLENRPDLWVWLGDIIYYDTEEMHKKELAYLELKTNKSYREFIGRIPVTGTWDDHDFGRNAAGSEYPRKKESQRLFLNFLDVPAESPRRQQEGIYSTYELGSGNQRVKVYNLDTRYFKTDTSLLGETQWKWLEKELRRSRAKVNIIASSITVLIDDQRTEMWSRFPREKSRLFKLIEETRSRGVVLITGDRHYGDISVVKEEVPGYPLYEVLSSGLTHHRDGESVSRNRHRVGGYYLGENFGLIEIQWGKDPQVSMQVRDVKNKIRLEKKVALSTLK